VTLIVETAIDRGETTIWVEEEWLRREREPSGEGDDPTVRQLRETEEGLRKELAQLEAALPGADLERARQAETEAEASERRVVRDEATGKATAEQVGAAQASMEEARARRAALERKDTTLRAEIESLQGQIRDTTKQRERAEKAAAERRRQEDRHLAGLIKRREEEGKRALALAGQLWDLLANLRQREADLVALGARPNPGFLAGYGARLEATIRGESTDGSVDEDLWRPWENREDGPR
jgi:chromosome segregation ATPase